MTAAVPETEMLAGQPGVIPVEGVDETVKVTVPVNPPIGVTVRVELPVAPELKSAGLVAEIVKSATADHVKVALAW